MNGRQELDCSRFYVCYGDGIGCNALTKNGGEAFVFDVQVLIGGLIYATKGISGRKGHGPFVVR